MGMSLLCDKYTRNRTGVEKSSRKLSPGCSLKSHLSLCHYVTKYTQKIWNPTFEIVLHVVRNLERTIKAQLWLHYPSPSDWCKQCSKMGQKRYQIIRVPPYDFVGENHHPIFTNVWSYWYVTRVRCFSLQCLAKKGDGSSVWPKGTQGSVFVQGVCQKKGFENTHNFSNRKHEKKNIKKSSKKKNIKKS